MKFNRNSEKGHTIVEATFVYPIVILVFFALFYAAFFVFKKASLQVNVENALLYYKSELTDNYVNMLNGFESDGEFSTGNKYEVPDSYKNPYRNVISTISGALGGGKSQVSSDKISSFVQQAYGLSDASVDVGKVKDFYLFKTIEVTGERSLDTAINVALVGGKNHMDMAAKTTFTVVDGDNIIRDVDTITNLIADSKFGKKFDEFKGKITDKYNGLIDKFVKK